MKYFIGMLLLAVMLVSCEKEVKIKVQGGDSKLVVDGYIESGAPPFIALTNSFSYFSKIDSSLLQTLFVHGAVVKVSDGSQEITLREYDTSFSGSQISFYSVDYMDPAALTFLGETEKFYTLSIDYNGKHYSAVTKIPAVKAPDSLWAAPPARPPDGIPDAMQVFVKYTDPDSAGNKGRYFTQRNSEPFFAPFNSVFDDNIVNGTTLTFPLSPGYNRAKEVNLDSASYFYKGDTVAIKWCAIDKGVYDFWNTLEFSQNSIGNPFSSPTQVTSNMKGGALGVWAGYGVNLQTVIIPH